MKIVIFFTVFVVSSFLFFSCRKPVDVIEEEILIDEQMFEEEVAPVTSIVIGDTIGDVGFEYFVYDDIDFTSCYYGNPNGGGVGVDFDGDSIIDICFFSYNESWSDMGYVENFSGSGMANMNNDLMFLTDSLGLAIVGSQILVDCDNNFIYDSGFGFCNLFSWSSIDDPEGGESYGGSWYDLEPSYFVFKIDNGDSIGVGWIYLNPTVISTHIISYGYQPNIEC